MGRLTAIVLGSAAGGAFPQWNCRCPVCALAWAGDSRVQPRTQTGIAVSAGDGSWTLINASPDLPSQIRATPALHPRGELRGSPVDAVVLTGAEIDQIAGLLSLRESSPFTLYATPASHAAVAANAMFGAMGAMSRRAINPGERFMLAGDIEATLFMVPGKLPLYLEGEAPELDTESAANVGIELHREGARMVFVPGTAAVTPANTSASPAASAAPGTDVELEFWRSVKDSNKPEELNAYITNYPNGQFKSLALSRIASLDTGSKDGDKKDSGGKDMTRNLAAVDPATFTDDATQLTEDQIGLDKGQRRDVQRRLNGLGFDTKITGAFNDDTRTVLKRWQAARGYPSTGYLNKLQHKALLTEIVSTAQTGSSDDDSGSSRRSSGGGAGGGRHYRSGGGGGGGGGGNPGAFMGGMIGGMMGGMMRH